MFPANQSFGFFLAPALLFLCTQGSKGHDPAERRTLESGASVVCVEDPGAPIVTLTFCFQGGRALESRARRNLVDLAAAVLSDRLRSLASVNAGAAAASDGPVAVEAREDELRLQVEFPAGEFATSLPALCECLGAHEVPVEALAEARARIDPTLRAQATVAAQQAEAVLGKLASGRGQAVEEEARSAEEFEAEDLEGFLARQCVQARLVVGVSGPLNLAAAENLLATSLAAMPRGDPPETRLVPAFIQPPRRQVWILDDSTGKEVQIALAAPGVQRDHPDAAALALWSALLENRIRAAIRAGDAPFRAARAGFVLDSAQGGAFRATIRTTLERAEPSLAWMLTLLSKSGRNVGSEELARARAEDDEIDRAQRASAAAVLESAIELTRYGYPLDLQEQLRARALRVGPRELEEAVQRNLDPERLLVLAVGPADSLEAALATHGVVARYQPLVEQLLAALGGREPWAELTALEVEITIQPSPGMRVRTHQWLDLAAPRYRVEMDLPEGQRTVLLDRERAFEVADGQATITPPETLAVLLTRNRRSLWSVVHRLAVGRGVHTRESGGRRIEVLHEGRSDCTLELDEAGRPVRLIQEEAGGLRTLLFEDWQDSGGYLWAAHVREEPTRRLWDITSFEPLESFDPALLKH